MKSALLPNGPALVRIYIAGPMSGLPEYNYPAFNAEASKLREKGFHVENPAEGPELPSWAAYMRRALRQMLTCEAICLLPGWTESKGATVEWLLACVLGMSIIYHQPPGGLHQRLYKMMLRWLPAERGAVVAANYSEAHAMRAAA
jgi:hypothetical protein